MARDQRETFEVKAEHLVLLKNANVDWHTCEWGAPQIDGKRPYGNSSIYEDMANLLGVKSLRSDEFVITEADEERLWQLHKETETALQICLATQSFQPGTYYRDGIDRYDYSAWKLLAKAQEEEVR